MARKKTEPPPAPEPAPPYVLPAGKALMLRNCAADMTSYGGFQWPASGVVTAPDWKATASCGNGLHGWLWGEGDGSLGYSGVVGARWLVCEVNAADVVAIGIDKVKVPEAVVLFVGSMVDAASFIAVNGGAGRKIIGGTPTSGDLGTSTSGDRGTSTSGYRGTSTSGDRGTSTSGDLGTSTSGDLGTSTSGDRGTSTSGDLGFAAAGKDGTLIIKWRDATNDRLRTKAGEIGIDGLEPGILYRVEVENGVARFVAVTDDEKAARAAEIAAYR